MPAALDVDWNAIRLEFAKGAKLEALSETHGIPLGTLTSRSYREGWMEMRPDTHTSRIVQEKAIEIAKTVGADWAAAGVRHREAMQRITARLVEHAESLQDEALLAKVDKLRTVDDMARRNLGLDQPVNPTLNLAVGMLCGGEDPLESAITVEIQSDESLTEAPKGAPERENDDSSAG